MLFACPACKSALNVRDELIGKAIRCGKCSQVLRIPAPVAAPKPEPAPPPQLRPIEDNASFRAVPLKQDDDDVFVPTLIDDPEPAMEGGVERQRHVEASEAVQYDEFGRIVWPRVPGAVVLAGFLWILVGLVCLFRIVFPVMKIASGPGRMPEGFLVMACVLMLASVLFAAMFLFCGITTNRGTAFSLLGYGIGSLVFGAYHLVTLIWVYLVTSQVVLRRTIADDAFPIAIHSFYAAALIFAGIFSLMRIRLYREMRYQRQKIRHALNEIERERRRRRRD